LLNFQTCPILSFLPVPSQALNEREGHVGQKNGKCLPLRGRTPPGVSGQESEVDTSVCAGPQYGSRLADYRSAQQNQNPGLPSIVHERRHGPRFGFYRMDENMGRERTG